MTWECRALGISKDGLFDPSCVPFAPAWTVGFSARFFSFTNDAPYGANDPSTITYKAVEAWRDANAGARMEVLGSGEVICEDETDANLLFLAFR
jgi:hypothetical protein